MSPRGSHPVAALAVAAGAVASMPALYARAAAAGQVHPVESHAFTPADAALVLGAKVHDDGRPSRFLRERVETAVRLWRHGYVTRIILSGAAPNREGLDEPAAMLRVTREMDVPDSAVVLDGDGVTTAASARGAARMGLASVIVCSQEFHLPRALLLCRREGMHVQGAFPPIAPREHTAFGYAREVAATWKAILSR